MEWNGVCYRLMIRRDGILCWKTRNLSTSSVDSNENDDNWPSPEKIQNFLSKYRLTFSQTSFLINDLWTKQFLSGNLILNRNSFTQVYLLTQMREKFPSFDSFYNRKVNGTSGKTHVVPIYRSSGNFQSQRAVFQFAMRQWPPPLSSPKTRNRVTERIEPRESRGSPLWGGDRWNDYWNAILRTAR